MLRLARLRRHRDSLRHRRHCDRLVHRRGPVGPRRDVLHDWAWHPGWAEGACCPDSGEVRPDPVRDVRLHCRDRDALHPGRVGPAWDAHHRGGVRPGRVRDVVPPDAELVRVQTNTDCFRREAHAVRALARDVDSSAQVRKPELPRESTSVPAPEWAQQVPGWLQAQEPVPTARQQASVRVQVSEPPAWGRGELRRAWAQQSCHEPRHQAWVLPTSWSRCWLLPRYLRGRIREVGGPRGPQRSTTRI